MLKTYRTVEQFGQDEIIIEKSTFIGYAKPVTSEEEALAFIQEIQKKHRELQEKEIELNQKDSKRSKRLSDKQILLIGAKFALI